VARLLKDGLRPAGSKLEFYLNLYENPPEPD
jgi:hypothetical protein